MNKKQIEGYGLAFVVIFLYTTFCASMIWGLELLFHNEHFTRTLFFVAGFYFYLINDEYVKPLLRR